MPRYSLDVDVLSAEAGTVRMKITAGGRTLTWKTDEATTKKMAPLVGKCVRASCTFTNDLAEDGTMLVEKVTVRK